MTLSLRLVIVFHGVLICLPFLWREKYPKRGVGVIFSTLNYREWNTSWSACVKLAANSRTKSLTDTSVLALCPVQYPGKFVGGEQNRSPKPRRDTVNLSCFDHRNISGLRWTQVSNTSFFSYVLFFLKPTCHGQMQENLSWQKCLMWPLKYNLFSSVALSICLKPQQMPVSWWFSGEILCVLMAEIHSSIKSKPRM